MKTLKFISHPATVIICFLLVLISGEHLGGFYLLYVLLGLPHGSIHSILAILGISILLFSNYKYKQSFKTLIEPFLNIVGIICLCLSLFFFFYRDENHYNYATFYQTVPQITLAVFSIFMLIYLILNVTKLRQA